MERSWLKQTAESWLIKVVAGGIIGVFRLGELSHSSKNNEPLYIMSTPHETRNNEWSILWFVQAYVHIDWPHTFVNVASFILQMYVVKKGRCYTNYQLTDIISAFLLAVWMQTNVFSSWRSSPVGISCQGVPRTGPKLPLLVSDQCLIIIKLL